MRRPELNCRSSFRLFFLGSGSRFWLAPQSKARISRRVGRALNSSANTCCKGGNTLEEVF